MKRFSKPSKLTLVCVMHYARMVLRSAIFVTLLVLYILYRTRGGEDIESVLDSRPIILLVVWSVFVVEMVLRFFPSRLESPGCQKQFGQNYVKTGRTEIKIEDNNAVILVALLWISFNLVFGALHMAGVFDDGIMILLCSFYCGLCLLRKAMKIRSGY